MACNDSMLTTSPSTCLDPDVCAIISAQDSGGKVLISDNAELLMRTFFAGFTCLIISIFGTVANVVNCLVFYSQGLKDHMNLSLFLLSFNDALFVFFFTLLSSAKILTGLNMFGFGEEHHITSSIYMAGEMYALKTTSGLYTMVIAVDRCVCVLFPLQAGLFLSTRTTGLILISMATIAQLGFICQPLKYYVAKTFCKKFRFVPSTFWLNNKEIINAVVYTTFGVTVPLVTFFIVSLATSITVLRLTSAVTWRRKTSSASIKQNYRQVALTKMLVFVACVYVLCSTSCVLIKAWRLFEEDFSINGLQSNLYSICIFLSDAFSIVNSSVNIFIYSSHSSRYKQKLKAALAICKGHNFQRA